jgi:Domain of unknown function (DUF4383)
MRFCAFLFGIVFIGLGIAGFLTVDNYLFGVLSINRWLNSLYIATGLVMCVIGFMKIKWITLAFQILGIAYALLAVLGFVYGEQNILGVFASNPANTWLHVIAATNALILGYGSKPVNL